MPDKEINRETKKTTIEKKEEAKTEPEKPAVKAKKENVMYIGPSITGVVMHSTTFPEGELPERVKKAIDTFRPLSSMFVPISELEEAVKSGKTNKPCWRNCTRYSSRHPRRELAAAAATPKRNTTQRGNKKQKIRLLNPKQAKNHD